VRTFLLCVQRRVACNSKFTVPPLPIRLGSLLYIRLPVASVVVFHPRMNVNTPAIHSCALAAVRGFQL